jgi:hypothetical protein
MIPVQVAVDHDIDGFGVDAVAGDHRKGVGTGGFGAFAAASVHLVAAAGFDQDRVIAGADHITVEAERTRLSSRQECDGSRVFGTTPNIAPPSHQ